MFCHCTVGLDSSVGIATRYGLDGPGIESLCGLDFPNLSRPTLGPTQSSVQWVPGQCQGCSSWSVVLTTHPPLASRLKKE